MDLPPDTSALEPWVERLMECADTRSRDEALLGAALCCDQARAAAVWRRMNEGGARVWRPVLSRGAEEALLSEELLRAYLEGEWTFAFPTDTRVLDEGAVALVVSHARDIECDVLASLVMLSNLLDKDGPEGEPHAPLPQVEPPNEET